MPPIGHFTYVSGNDWWANPDAPWNQPELVYETCHECEGIGGRWYNEDGVELSKDEYDALSEEDKDSIEFVECRKCEGLGTVVVEPYNPSDDL